MAIHLQTASFAKDSALGLIDASFEAVWRTLSSTLPGSKTSATRPAALASAAVMGVPNRIICIACDGDRFLRVSLITIRSPLAA